MKDKPLQILVIDDDPIFRNLARSILKEDFVVFVAEVPSQAFKILNKEAIDIIICDFVLPEMNGLKVLEKVKEEFSGIEVIMISASGDMDTVIGALQKGASDFIKKPFTAPELWLSIERAKKLHGLHADLFKVKKKNSILNETVSREVGNAIVGKSAEIVLLKEQMAMVAQTPDTSVLIIGESGTGKELVARGIHQLSKRKDEIFGAVNMSAVPESLFESEFFGHKKGSFTGAIADRAGWFETTNGGTLFLDEIGELSMALQVKLLRVLDDRWYTKLGTQREQTFDVRIVAATNKPIEELTDGKSFRLDLFHRIGTFIIHMPPLRERKGDIPDLAHHFLALSSIRMGKKISTIHKDVFALFKHYYFPGNIRELSNLIERAVIMCQGSALLPVHFASVDLSNTKPHSQGTTAQTFDLRELEKQTILTVLKKVKYNKAEAARLLNLEWNALYRRIQKFNIEFPADPS
jgi:DNA-binding NtrC family response regulator